MDRKTIKWIVLLGSLVAAGLISRWGWLRVGASEPIFVVLDNRVEVEQLLIEGQVAPEALEPLSPDVLIERVPWTRSLAMHFFPQVKGNRRYVFDEIMGVRRASHLRNYHGMAEHPKRGYPIETNARGFRDDEIKIDVDLRCIFAGDSQTEGVCGNDESFVNLLEARLAARHPDERIDVLNAALGGSGPWYYLTTLEGLVDLEPDLFVAVFYGGNDLRQGIGLESFYRGRPPGNFKGQAAFQAKLEKLPAGLGAVELQQVQYFLDNPDDQPIAVDTWTAIAMEIDRQCDALGAEFLPVYMPPPLVSQPREFESELAQVAELMPEIAAALDQSDRMADAWLADLRSHGVEPFDLRPTFAAAGRRLYWDEGYHLNLEGQVVVAAALEEALAGRVALRLAGRSEL